MKIISILYFLTSSYIFAQVGEIIWVENFNNLENWMKITGNGSWGWGNGELEYYQEDNVDIIFIPDLYLFIYSIYSQKYVNIYVI